MRRQQTVPNGVSIFHGTQVSRKNVMFLEVMVAQCFQLLIKVEAGFILLFIAGLSQTHVGTDQANSVNTVLLGPR